MEGQFQPLSADGAELLGLGGLRAVSAHHRGGGGDLAVDLGFGFKDAETELLTDEAAFDHELVAGLHDALEAGVVDAGEVEEAVLAIHVFGETGKGHDGAGLGHGFNDEDAGHHGNLREVARELRFVHRHVLDHHDAVEVVGKLHHPVDQEERVAVGEHVHDVGDVKLGRHRNAEKKM